MRKARYRGRRKTRLQAFLAATVANFKRLAVLDVTQRAFLAAAEPLEGDRPHRRPRGTAIKPLSPHSRARADNRGDRDGARGCRQSAGPHLKSGLCCSLT